MRKILVDTDTASDDAVALVMALKYPEVNVVAITTIAGNIPVDKATQNAVYTAQLCNTIVPVHQGAAQPILKELSTAQFVHGQDGFGDIGLPLSGYDFEVTSAVDAIIDAAKKYSGILEIICLGPLTNIAIALLKKPVIAHQIKCLYIMGGTGHGPGNITPVAEYNIWADPEATQIVLQSTLHKTMIGWDVTLKDSWFSEIEIAKVKAMNTPLSSFVLDIQTKRIEFEKGFVEGVVFHLADPIAMAVALDETCILKREAFYAICMLDSKETRGQVILYPPTLDKHKNVTVVTKTDREKFLKMIYQSL